MTYKTYTFGAAVHFLFEKRNKTYKKYVDVSIAKEKCAEAQKQLQRTQFGYVAGSCGV